MIVLDHRKYLLLRLSPQVIHFQAVLPGAALLFYCPGWSIVSTGKIPIKMISSSYGQRKTIPLYLTQIFPLIYRIPTVLPGGSQRVALFFCLFPGMPV